MHKLLLSAALAFQTAAAPAQDYCDPDNCLFWNPPAGQILDSANVIYAYNQWSIDEWDNVSCTFPVQQCENLGLEVFFPVLPAGEKRPLVVLIHGGAFVGGDKSALRNEARTLAQLGFVAATINYRLCKRNNCLLLNWISAGESILAPAALCGLNFWNDFGTGAYVATVDAHNAVRYLQQNAAQYHIDPDNVIVGGFSAGGWTAMNMAFLDQDEADGMGNWSGTWGPLNPANGIRGALCLCGAIMDTAFIDPDERLIPVFSVHGTCDATVCYRRDAPFHCNNTYPRVYGGGDLSTRLHHNGNPYYLFTGQNLGHDLTKAQNIWETEMLRFMREAMLCGQPIRKHAVFTMPAPAEDCPVLQGPLVQAPHAPHAPVNLPASPLWGGFPAPCTPLPAPEIFGSLSVSIRPTLTHDAPVRVESQSAAFRCSVWNPQGQLLFQSTSNAGNTSEIPADMLAPGLNIVRIQTAGNTRPVVCKVFKM